MALFYIKNPTNALMYVNITSVTLLHLYNFQLSMGYLEGVLIHLRNQVNKMALSIENFSFYRTENTLLFQYRDQSLNGAWK